MKLLMLNNEYPPLGGGQANANYYLYKEFEKYKDIQIDIITSSTNEYKEQNTKIGKIYFLDIGKKDKNLHFQTSKELITYSLKSLSLAKRLIKQNKYDIIVAWSGVPAGYLAYRLNKKFNLPYIVLLRGSDVPFWEKRWYYLDKFIFSWLSPKIWKNATKTIANSKGLKEQALNVAPTQKIEVIFNGIDLKDFKPSNNNNKIVKIFSAGRLIPRKSLDLQIKALSQIKSNFSLNIAGDGPEKENLEKLISDLGMKNKIKLLGMKNKEEMKKLYSDSDIYLFTSKNEGMSNTILEAMASGLPIITTNVAGVEELIKGNGFIIGVDNESELKDKLDTLIKNKSLRNKMGNKSRKLAEQMSWSKIAKSFYTKFKEIKK